MHLRDLQLFDLLNRNQCKLLRQIKHFRTFFLDDILVKASTDIDLKVETWATIVKLDCETLSHV